MMSLQGSLCIERMCKLAFGNFFWPLRRFNLAHLGTLWVGRGVAFASPVKVITAAVAVGPSFPKLLAFTFRRFSPPDSAFPPSAGSGTTPCPSPECEPGP
jgi:hypothetical protein